MKVSANFKKLLESAKLRPAYWAEKAMLDIARQMHAMMEKKNIKQIDIAQRLGKKPAAISRALSGQHNVTVATLSELAFALDMHLDVRLVDNKAAEKDVLALNATSTIYSFADGVSVRSFALGSKISGNDGQMTVSDFLEAA